MNVFLLFYLIIIPAIGLVLIYYFNIKRSQNKNSIEDCVNVVYFPITDVYAVMYDGGYLSTDDETGIYDTTRHLERAFRFKSKEAAIALANKFIEQQTRKNTIVYNLDGTEK